MSSVMQCDNETTKSHRPRVSAYTFFQKDLDQRAKVIESLGETASFGDISKGMSAKWKALSESERAIYNELANKAKESPELKPLRKKRARSSYTIFTMNPEVKNSIREEHPDVSFQEFSKYLSEKWNAMSDEDKKPYCEASDKEKLELSNQQSNLTKTTKRKRARTAYVFYVSDESVRTKVKSENPEASFGEISKILAKQWKELSGDDREQYDKLSKEESEKMVTETTVTKPARVRLRARTAYTFYTMDEQVRNTLKTKYPDAKFSEFSKILSTQWKGLTETDKLPYNQKSQTEKQEMAKILNTKKPKQKRGRSAYTLYSSDKEVRDKVKTANPEANFGEISKILSKQWKELSEQAKTPYIQLSNVEKEKTLKEKLALKPPKTRAKSAYLHYSMDPKIRNLARKEHENISVTELAKILGAQWKKLDQKAKIPYQQAYETEKSQLSTV